MDILMHKERWNGKRFCLVSIISTVTSELKISCGTHANSNCSDCPKYATERKRERDRKNNREREREGEAEMKKSLREIHSDSVETGRWRER